MDSKKVLWTVISVGLFLVVFFGTALMLFAPRRGAPEAPASVMNQTPPRAADPTEYLLAPVPALVPEPAAAIPPPGEVVIVYGERPPPAPDAVLPVPSRPGAYAPAPPVPAARPPAARPPERPPAPVPRPRTVTVAEWWIQAASPTSRSGAENLRAELSRRGLSAVITLRDVDGTT
ncbi:MAG TPA: SPOR domain-containing protein, partial [Magnetospirillaceae bacterium]|nr:SPOR domain-containing protein [Magnetospirillaceae bacterium]